MKHLALAFLLPLCACQTGAINSAGSVAATTVLDEQIGIGAEAAYTTAATLGTALAKAGIIDVAKFKALDNQAYSALLVTRSAYLAGNASDYLAASVKVYAAVAQIKALVK